MGEGTRTGPSWPALAFVTVAAIASAGVATAVWTTPGGNAPPAVVDPAVQLATLAEACDQWTEETGNATLTSDDDRCGALTGWLSDTMTQSGRSAWMLWGEPEKLRAMCLGWLTARPPPDLTYRDGVAWCEDLVTWMAGHTAEWRGRGGWEGWLRDPSISPLLGP